MKLYQIKLFWNLLRPKTLLASICPVLVALLLYVKNTISLHENLTLLQKLNEICLAIKPVFLVTLACAVCLQILSNVINDYFDYKKGSDQKGRIGFLRPLAENLISIKQIQILISFFLVLALVFGVILVVNGGIFILIIGITAVISAFLYSATRFALSYLGIADIFCVFYYGILAVMGTFHLISVENPQYNLVDTVTNPTIIASGLVCGVIAAMVLMINNLRDENDDAIAGKKTLVVRFGKANAQKILLVYCFVMLIATFIAFSLSFTNLISVFAILLFGKIRKDSGKKYNKSLFMAGLLDLVFVFLVLLETIL